MTRASGVVVAAVLALASLTLPALAQENPAVRRVLALDLSRVAPFHRWYDIIVHGRDSSTSIGTREVTLQPHEMGGTAGWLLVETRTGAVPSAETLFVASDMRPVSWSASLGPARLAVAFVGDTLMGATTLGGVKQNIRIAGRPDLLVSGSMVELILGLLPLDAQWSDSAAVLALSPSGSQVRPAEITLLGEEEIPVDSLGYRRAHVVALRTEQRSILYWLDMESRVVLRMQQVLPPHAGILLEYRLRPAGPPQTPLR